MDATKQQKISEQNVLQSELKSMKTGARVYKQQQNSNVYFLANKDKVFEECKKTLDDLTREYKEVEGETTPSEPPRH